MEQIANSGALAGIKLLTIAITNKCNLSCGYCPIAEWRNNPAYPDRLTLESTLAFIDRAKPTHIEITGGEPTLVPWLGDLLNEIEKRGIIYLVKSNGLKRCKNQITAWHGEEMPVNYDKMLIIKDTPHWDDKALYCDLNKIPYKVIGKDNNNIHASNNPAAWIPAQQLFLCPDGHLKTCHEHEVICSEKPRKMEEEFEWIFSCPNCKAVSDFIVFLDKLTTDMPCGIYETI
jgi:organic radical activating enzyme